jgi:ATP-dependent DNA helicase RecG
VELAELLERLRQEENLHSEFKTWPVQPDDVAASIAAFANTDGGAIFLGVDNSGQVVGLDETAVDRVAQFIDNVAFNNCAPPVTVVQETLRHAQGHVVLILPRPPASQGRA